MTAKQFRILKGQCHKTKQTRKVRQGECGFFPDAMPVIFEETISEINVSTCNVQILFTVIVISVLIFNRVAYPYSIGLRYAKYLRKKYFLRSL